MAKQLIVDSWVQMYPPKKELEHSKNVLTSTLKGANNTSISNYLKEDIEMNKSTYEKRGNPFRRGNTWTILYYPIVDGKKVQKSKGGFKTKRDAQEELDRLNAELTTGTYVSENKLTVKEFITKLFEDEWKYKLRPNTISSYRVNIYNHIIPVLGDIKLKELNEYDIQKLFDVLREKELCETTVNYVYRVLNTALKYAVKKHKIPINPCDFLINIPKPRNYEADTLSEEEYEEFVKLISNHKHALEIHLALDYGLRRGEVLGLKVKDIDFEHKVFFVEKQLIRNQETKKNELAPLKTTKSKRIIPFDKELEYLLKERITLNEKRIKGYSENDLICCNANGKTLSPSSLSKVIIPIRKKMNKPNLRYHGLRHTCGKRLVEEDVNIKAVQHLLGHTHVGTTMDIYCKNAHMVEVIRAGMNKLKK